MTSVKKNVTIKPGKTPEKLPISSTAIMCVKRSCSDLLWEINAYLLSECFVISFFFTGTSSECQGDFVCPMYFMIVFHLP